MTNGIGPYLFSGNVVPSWMSVTTTPGSATTFGSITFSGTPPISPYPSALTNFSVIATVTDALGVSFVAHSWAGIVANSFANQPQQGGANVGTSSSGLALNFTGSGVSSVTNDGTTMTVTILGAMPSAPTTDVTIPANSSAIVVRKYTIASGTKLTIGSGAIFKIE